MTITGPNDLIAVPLKFCRYGYAYGRIDTATFIISAVALLTYVAMGTGMILYLGVVRRTSTAWSTVGDILALALKSKPTPFFEDAGAGVRHFKTWKHVVQVRDVGNQDLAIVSRDGDDGAGSGAHFSRVEVGKKYS